MPADLREKVAALRPRELECLRGVCAFKRTDQIAHELGLSPKTVDNHIARASARLGVSDRASAARLLIEAAKAPWGKSLAGFLHLDSQAPPRPHRWLLRLPWPWPTEWRPENDLSFAAKLALVFVLAAVMMGAAAAYLGIVLLLDRNS